MVNLIFFILFAVIVFFCSLIGYKKYFSVALYALAIGGVVNSMYFGFNDFPINIFNLNFGIDSIIYSLFLFAVLMMFFETGKKNAIMLTVSSVLAILFAAHMELFAKIFSDNISMEMWQRYWSFIFTFIASLGASICMIYIVSILKNKTKINEYLLLIIGMGIGSFINTTIFYGLNGFIQDLTLTQIGISLASSYIGKALSILVGLLVLFVKKIIDKHLIKNQ